MFRPRDLLTAGLLAAIALLLFAVPAHAGYAFVAKWGSSGTGNGEFSHPHGIATDAAGNVYVADRANHRVQKFTSNGAFLTKWGSFGDGNGEFAGPVGIATDAAGNIYVVDVRNHRVQKFTSNGAFLTKWGSVGSGNGEFSYPRGIATDAAGNVYVVDHLNNRVQKFGPVPGQGATPPPLTKPTITSGTKGKTNRRKATLRFRSNSRGGRLQCKLTGKRVPRKLQHWRRCTSPKKTYKNLKPGKKVFWVRELRSGKSSKPARKRWKVGKTP